MSTTEERAAFTDGLRQLADWLDANPQVDLPWTGDVYDPFKLGVWLSKEELAEIVRALPGRVEKQFDDTVVRVKTSFGGLRVEAYSGRNEVCERVVVGTEKVTVPAVEATPERVEEREVVEWRCHPILADDEQAVAS